MSIRLVFEPENGWTGAAKSERLSTREMVVLALAAEGYNNKEIAEGLGIKYQTVKNTFHRLTKKLGAKNNVHALKLAMQSGLMKIEIIADELDESLPVEERERAKLWREKESRKESKEESEKIDKMSEEELRDYMWERNREALEEEDQSMRPFEQPENEGGTEEE